jgi:amino acid adenylation domain-containing protein
MVVAYAAGSPISTRARSAPAAGAHRFVQLSTDVERSSTLGYEAAYGATATVDLPGGAVDAAQRAAIVGAFGALLHRYTQQATIAIDVILRSRSASGRAVPVDVAAGGEDPVSAAIAQAETALGRSGGSAEIGAEARSNVAAIFVDAPRRADGSLDLAPCADGPTSAYDLELIISSADGATLLAFAYNARLFRPATIDRLLASAATLLGAALRARDTVIDRLPLLSPSERHALTVERESGTATYPAEPVHRLFEALAKTQPDAPAAFFHGKRLTYRELDERSSRLAHHLIAAGVGPSVPVAVCIRPSPDILVALVAIYKARGLYFPLDPTHPEALLTRMLDEARPRLVLTHAALSALTHPDRFPQVCLDTDEATFAAQPSTAPAVEPSFDDPAYLLYTSGTTGRPKGVVATQGNLAHYIHVAQQRYRFCKDDVFSSLARYTFSISLFDLMSPLACGGSVLVLDRDEVLTPEKLCRALEDVTVVHAGPSLLGSLFRYLRATPSAPRSFPRMRHASSGGDMVGPQIMEEMKQVFENAEIYVIYGCTEISCMGTTFPVLREKRVTRTFVGKPFPDVTVRVLDPKRDLVPFGVVGEICFAGKGIVRGYLDRPELTAEKFVPIDGQRFYLTGDMVRLHEDGNVEILGRRDFQVQLRGIRIELAGIEKTVHELGLAAQCAVVSKKLDDDDVRLVAFVVNPKETSAASFRKALAAQLPDYMLPQHVVVLEAMPLTANGKLDRNRLQEMPWDTQLGAGAAAPGDGATNDVERQIAAIFARVLGIGQIGMDQDFFDMGGHSLLAVVAMQEIKSVLGITIPPHVVFESATVRALAAHAQEAGADESRPILLNEKPGAAPGPALFMLSGMHLYRPLAEHLRGRYAAYGVFAAHEIAMPESAKGLVSVPTLARDYAEIIRRQQPVGPYRLLGYSFGGLVAYEVAQQLQAAGQEVRFLALIDAVLPEWTSGWKFRLAQLARVRSTPRRHLFAWIMRRLREKLGSPAPEFARFKQDDKLGPLEAQRDVVNGVAAAKYLTDHIRPFGGNVTLIASGERLRHDPLKSRRCGWGPYVPSLDVHTVDADHWRMLSDEPYVAEMADILLKRMERLDRGR